MKKVLLLLLSASIILSACGEKAEEQVVINDEVVEVAETEESDTKESVAKGNTTKLNAKKESSTNETTGEEITKENKSEENVSKENTSELEMVSDNRPFLMMGNINEQVGGEPLEIDNYTMISEKNGYTYVVNLYPVTNELVVSIIKDNRFAVKNKEAYVDAGGFIGSSGLYGNHLLYVDDSNKNVGNVITIGEDGELNHSTVPTSEGSYFSTIKGLGGSYFEVEKEDGSIAIVNYAGEELYTYTYRRFGKDILFIDEYKGRIYLDGNEYTASVFDIEADDMVWAEDGSEERVKFPASKYHHYYVGDKNGFYVLHETSLTEGNVYFFTTENDDVQLGTESYLSSSLPRIQKTNVNVTVDEENFNVYKSATYKGEPTLQKFSYPRVDLWDN